MRGLRLDGISICAFLAFAAGTAVPPAAFGQQQTEIEAAIPVPEPADVPPPTIADLDPPSADGAASRAAPSPSAPVPPAMSASTPAAAGDAGPATTAAVPPAPETKAESAATAESGVPVPEPADVPPPTAADIGKVPLAPADQAVADQLRTLVTTRIDRFVDGKKERNGLEAFYKARDYAPLWASYGKPSDAMKATIKRLQVADADGLDANDYATPDLAMLTDAESMAQAELKLMNSLLLFARHAQSGRVTASRISTNIEVAQPVPEPADVLKAIADAKDAPAAAMDRFNPPHEGFRLLKAKLLELRGSPEDHVVQIPKGPLLRPAVKPRKGQKARPPMKDARVPLLRERLKVEGDPEDTTYEGAVVEAIIAFQKSKGLAPNGVLNEATLNALNGRSRSRDINAVLSNMERWRWLPRNLGQSYVMVNIPDFTLKVVRDQKLAFHTRIVVGKQTTPSPVFSDEIETIQVNPTWHVPQSIIYGEYLPALQQDPSVLARMGLVLTRNRDGSISVRQPPGERNALGRIKFNFPNRFQVYLHDTPQKHLFAHDRRAYSHGCMRVQNPDQFGEVLASIALPGEGYTAQRFTKMYGGGENWIKLKKFIPVHLVYMNAYVDEAGKLVVRDDVYGYDNRVQSALNGKYIAVAERSQRVTPGQVQRGAGRRNQAAQRPESQGFFLFQLFR